MQAKMLVTMFLLEPTCIAIDLTVQNLTIDTGVTQVLKDLLTLQAVTVIGILPNMGVMSIPWDVVTDSIIKIKEFMIALHGRVDYSIQTGPKLPGTDNIAFPISQQKGIKCEALLVYPL